MCNRLFYTYMCCVPSSRISIMYMYWEFQIELASALYDKGLLITDKPLEPVTDSESDEGNAENKKPDLSRDRTPRGHSQTLKSSVI